MTLSSEASSSTSPGHMKHTEDTGLYCGYLALGVATFHCTETECRRSLLSGVYAVGPFCLVFMS